MSLRQNFWWEVLSWGAGGSQDGVFCGGVSMHNSALSVCVQLLKIVIWNPATSLWFLALFNII